MFDSYTLKARFYPVIIMFLPISIVGLFYSLELQSLKHLAGSAVIVGALTYLFSQLGRDRGKRKEAALWAKWGGTPSIQLLRWSNDRIGHITKERYHKTLAKLTKVPGPDLVIETSNPDAANDVYAAWCKYLLGQTRDEKKFPLLLKDNTSYGFRRNLWGLKIPALIILTLLLIGNFGYSAITTKTINPIGYPTAFYYASAALILISIFWIFSITKKWVHLAAFSYAERLCETVDILI